MLLSFRVFKDMLTLIHNIVMISKKRSETKLNLNTYSLKKCPVKDGMY